MTKAITMKKVFDFVFCDDELDTSVVFYSVKVGTSVSEQSAWRFVLKQASNNNFFVKVHSADTQLFIEKCAQMLFPLVPLSRALQMMRREFIEVKALASFLRKYPAALLNSRKIGSSFSNVTQVTLIPSR